MRVCFDTSVLVPALVSPHPSHPRALCRVQAAANGEIQRVMAWHARPLAMTPALYRRAMQRCTERGEGSGAIFDALHLVAAEAAQSDALVTLNPTDFERLSNEHGPRIIVPPDPPRVAVG